MNHRRITLLSAVLASLLAFAALSWHFLRASPQATLAAPDAPAALTPLYLFSGVTDDGQKGSATRREATSILCTNTGTVNATIYVEIYQWSGTLVYTGTVNAPPRSSYTFSTQNTTIYFDDVILGPGGGTGAIFQGSGRVLGSRPHVICTAQVLDPLSYPPVYLEKLAMYRADGRLIGRNQRLFLPMLTRR